MIFNFLKHLNLFRDLNLLVILASLSRNLRQTYIMITLMKCNIEIPYVILTPPISGDQYDIIMLILVLACVRYYWDWDFKI